MKKITVNKYVFIVIGVIIAILCVLVIYFNHKAASNALKVIDTFEQDGIYSQVYYEREFNALKEENKQLYDSLKNQKDKITSVAQFKYKKIFVTDTVYIENEIPSGLESLPDNTYVYSSDTDTVSYELQINSKVEPNWYQLKAEINDKFTIVNKDYGNGQQVTTVETDSNAELSDFTAWQKPQTKKWYQRFAVGPTVSAGFDPINRNVGFTIGVGITYDILTK